MWSLTEKVLDGNNEYSYAHHFRMKRMRVFEEWFSACFLNSQRIHILDLGGRPEYWNSLHFSQMDKSEITILNVEETKCTDKTGNFHFVIGDATNLSIYCDNSFDLCFSNSVIEHVGNNRMQIKMVEEMHRVGKHVYLQTPNYWFPMEPHFGCLFFHWLPHKVKVWLLMHFALGWFPKCKSIEEANGIVDSIHLLNYKELKALFPNARIYREKVLWMTKSFYLFE